ncbi:MAG: DUF3822 family protein [Candidatus Dadabacteria bacterium]
MKTLFHIQTEEQDSSEDILLLEVGKDYCCLGIYNDASKAIKEIKYFTFPETESGNALGTILQDLEQKAYSLVKVASNYSNALLVPSEYSKNSDTLLTTIYSGHTVEHLQDRLNNSEIITAYSFPIEVYKQLKDSFHSVQFRHLYSCMISGNRSSSHEHILSVHLTTTDFSVVYLKLNEVQLAQTFSYVSALDVVYYLLKLCFEFKLSQTDVQLFLSGLVAKDSSMYLEIQNYFLNLKFAEQPELKLPETDHPQYFFTSLYNLAVCA